MLRVQISLVPVNLPLGRNINESEWVTIVKLTKSEAFKMRELLGSENVKKTYSKHPTYYLVESRRNIKCLEKFRKEHIVKMAK